MIKARFLPASIDACASWRFFQPHLRIPNSKFVFNPGFALPVEELEGVDVAVVQRLARQENYGAIQILKNNGLKVIYDLDDNLWNIPKYNPNYKAFAGPVAKENFRICMDACHEVTVSTPALQAAVRKFVRRGMRVTVIPNCIDFDLFYPLPKIEREEVVIGWAGTNTHDVDTAEVFELLVDVLKQNKHLRCEIVGAEVPERLAATPGVSTRFYVPIAEYPSRLASWRWDITVAPLIDSLFNRSKSNIKILESAALKTPILFSPVATYLDFVSLDKELKYLVCKTKQQWKDKIVELGSSKELREKYGKLLYKVAKEHYSTMSSAAKWQEVFERVCTT